MLLLFKKGKNAPETHTQKICAVYGRIEYVRSDLWSFVLEISHGRVLHG